MRLVSSLSDSKRSSGSTSIEVFDRHFWDFFKIVEISAVLSYVIALKPLGGLIQIEWSFCIEEISRSKIVGDISLRGHVDLRIFLEKFQPTAPRLYQILN